MGMEKEKEGSPTLASQTMTNAKTLDRVKKPSSEERQKSLNSPGI